MVLTFQSGNKAWTSGYVFVPASFSHCSYIALGFLRSLAHHHLHPELSIRLNAVTPHYTDTPLIPRTELESAGFKPQTADVVARSAALLMADNTRHGQAIYSVGGKYLEVEERMIAANLEILGLKTNLVPDFE